MNINQKNEMFTSLVENALDFLAKAITELKDQPKYSVINFHAAVELFMKARLMHTKWSLVSTKTDDQNWDKFVAGDFQSVTFKVAVSRLDKVVGSPLKASEIAAFNDVARHRNKMVHFFHEANSSEESDELTRRIVKQQLTAWHFLHQLLTVKWAEEFSNWQTSISEIDIALRKLHEFLQVVFDSLQSEIEAQKVNGIRFDLCPSCEFVARQTDDAVEREICEARCLVCGLVEKSLEIECRTCGEKVIFRNDGYATCATCGEQYEPEDVAEALIDSGAAHIAAMEGDDSFDAGNCSDCDGYHTVVRTENNCRDLHLKTLGPAFSAFPGQN